MMRVITCVALALLVGCSGSDESKIPSEYNALASIAAGNIDQIEELRDAYVSRFKSIGSIDDLYIKPENAPKDWERMTRFRPIDPWGNPFRMDAENEVFSIGPDGKPATDDDIH